MSVCWREIVMHSALTVSSLLEIITILSLPFQKPNRLAVKYFTLCCCGWRVCRETRGNSTLGSNPCPGPLPAGVSPVSSSSVLSPWVGAGKRPTLNYLWRLFNRLFHLVPGVLSLFCFLLSYRVERDLGSSSGYFGAQGLLGHVWALLVTTLHTEIHVMSSEIKHAHA